MEINEVIIVYIILFIIAIINVKQRKNFKE